MSHRSPLRGLGAAATAAAMVMLLAPPPASATAPDEPAVPLSPCYPSDAAVPTWGEPVFSPTAVDVTHGPQEVTLTLPVEDQGGPGTPSGVTRVEASVLGERQALTEEAPGLWSATFTVHRKTSAGDHAVDYVAATDAALNTNDSRDEGRRYPELDAASFAVVSAPLPSPAPAPVPTSLTLSKEKVNVKKKARRIRFNLVVDESAASVLEARLNFSAYGTRTVTLTRTDDGFTGTAKIGRVWNGTFRAKVQSLTLIDEYGTLHRTYSGALRRKLGAESVRVVSRKDKGDPKVVSSSLKPRTIDARTKKKRVTVRMRLRDSRSGVKRVQVHLGPNTPVIMKKRKGTRKNGVWRGRVDVGPCNKLFSSGRPFIVVRDRADNVEETFGARFAGKTNDLRRPRATLVHPDGSPRWKEAAPVRLRFNERVTGINADSFRVVHSDAGFWGEPLVGSLHCEKKSGADVSCGSKKVRRAVWTPAPGALDSGETYVALINPDGVLDVRDRQGNPHLLTDFWFSIR